MAAEHNIFKDTSMTKKPKKSTQNLPFINARLTHARLVSEKATSTAIVWSKEPSQVQLRTETSSTFSIGLDSPDAPKLILIKIDYKVALKTLDTDKLILEYEASHEAQLSIKNWTGFDDWTNMPSIAVAPYLAVLNNIALRKAEGTIFEMGFKGVVIPQPETFDEALIPS